MAQGDGQDERALVRKIAWRTLPLILLSYFIAFVDRANISFAASTMNADLGFSEAVYGIGASAFFIGYALFEVPSNLALARFGARRWLARIMLTWGLISAATAFIHGPWQFYIMRFFSAMGTLAAPLLALDGWLGLRGWQWLLIAEGLPSVLLAAVLLAALPDRPETARWLSDDERTWLTAALCAEAAATGDVPHSLLRALLHPAVLMLGLANALNFLAINAITFSAPNLLARDTGLNVAGVGQIVSAGGVAIAFGLLIVSLLVGKTVTRTLATYAGLMLAASGGMALLWLGGTAATSTGGYILFVGAAQTAGMLPLAIISRLVPPADRAAGLAMANTISQCGAFLGPLIWGLAASATGSYNLGVALLLPFALASAVTALLVRRASARPA